MRLPLLAPLAALLLAVAPTPANAAPRNPRLAHLRTWAFGIGDGLLRGNAAARFAGYDLVVVDGEEATKTQVTALHRNGALVLAYLDVGTIEPGRSWYAAAKRYRLDYWPDWGEWYADVSRSAYRHLIDRRVAAGMLSKGFDGLFLDNTDMVETHRARESGMRSLVAALARRVHRAGKLLFTQNGEDSISSTLRYYDGWNREDVTWTYDFDHRRYVRESATDVRTAQAALRRIARAGLLVTATDYTRAGDAADAADAHANARAAGALSYVSDVGLDRVPPPDAGP